MKTIRLDEITIHPNLLRLYELHAFRETQGDLSKIDRDKYVASQVLRPVHLIKKDTNSYLLISGFPELNYLKQIGEKYAWAIIHTQLDEADLVQASWISEVIQLLQAPHRKSGLRDIHSILELATPNERRKLIINTGKRELLPLTEYLSDESRNVVRNQVIDKSNARGI
uniref:hypothetical protein n=1 Tax=Roseivirga sp. TaxID=1964215 RepID=UPI0040478CF3